MKQNDPLAWLFRLALEFNLVSAVAMVAWLVWTAPQVLAGETRPLQFPVPAERRAPADRPDNGDSTSPLSPPGDGSSCNCQPSRPNPVI